MFTDMLLFTHDQLIPLSADPHPLGARRGLLGAQRRIFSRQRTCFGTSSNHMDGIFCASFVAFLFEVFAYLIFEPLGADFELPN